jgi:MoxR-like ATPase
MNTKTKTHTQKNNASSRARAPKAPRPVASAPVQLGGYAWPELRSLVGTTLRAGISTLVRGHPGVGKSTLARALADEFGLPLIDIRLAQREPADLSGVWFPDPEARTLIAYPPAWAKEARDRPSFIFLDEINAAVTKLHQAAAYQLVLERRVGDVCLHPETVVMAAGNLEDDAAIVTPLSSALCNRFAHFTLRVDARTWLEWGEQVGLEPAVLAYVARFGEEVLYAHDGESVAFPSPRSWELASRVFARGEERERRRLVAACVGAPAAERFFGWLQLYRRVDPERAIREGEAFDFTTGPQADPSFVYAVTCSVGAWLRDEPALTDRELDHVVRFFSSPGFDAEYAILCLRQLRRNDALFTRLRALPEFRQLAASLVQLSVGVAA